MPEDQAEVLARGQSDLYERLVTKEHFEFTLSNKLEKLRLELKNDIDKVQANLEQVKAANKQALKELELTLKHELETTKTELKRDIKEMERHHRFVDARQTLLSALSVMWPCPEAGM